ncbi:MAG: helix-turn-helix domain-containing protein [Roseibium sp.]
MPRPDGLPIPGYEGNCQAAKTDCVLQHHCGFHVRNCICSELQQYFGASLPQGTHKFTMQPGDEIDPDSLPNSPVLGILTGSVGMVTHLSDGRRTISGLFFPGDYINLASLGRQSCGEITALAASAVQLMEQSVFDRLLSISEGARTHFFTQTNKFLFRQLDHSNDLAKKTPIERIAAFIFELINRSVPRKSNQMTSIAIPFGRRDIADYLGLQPETVSRGFTSLTNEGVITLPEADLVTIENVKHLRQIANGGRPRKRGI